VAVLLQRAHSNLDDRLWRSVVRPPSRLPRQRCSCTQSSTDVDCSRLGGRKSDGPDGKRTGNTGHQRSLPVNNGHTKTVADQGRNPLTRVGEKSCRRQFDSPQLHRPIDVARPRQGPEPSSGFGLLGFSESLGVRLVVVRYRAGVNRGSNAASRTARRWSRCRPGRPASGSSCTPS
jgi:hypothetical protein